MWEHGMPGITWSMAIDLARWEELRDAEEDAEPEEISEVQEAAFGAEPASGIEKAAFDAEPASRGFWSRWAAKGEPRPRTRARRWRQSAGVITVVALAVFGITAATGTVRAGGATDTVSSGAALRAAIATGAPVVLLGDSYAAGPLVPVSPSGGPIGCLRSTHNYGADVVAALKAKTFTDAACSGATSANMTTAQSTLIGTNPAQFGVLKANDALVMLTVGGDDVGGGFSHLMETCVLLSFTDPSGAPCAEHFGSSLASEISADAKTITGVLTGIKARAPHAEVLLVGYPDVFPATGGGCWPAVPIASGDIAYLRGLEQDLNQMLASAAVKAGATYVNTYTPTIGHDFCQPEDVRYVEGLIPGSVAEPFHPNARGYSAITNAVLRVIG